MGGDVAKSVEKSWLVESTAAHALATMVPVGSARFAYLSDAIAVKFKRTSCVTIGRKRRRAASRMLRRMAALLQRSGLVHSSARTPARDSSTAISMLAKGPATRKMPAQLIAHDRPTWYLTVHAARPF